MSVPFLITRYDICAYLVRVGPVHECRNIGTHVRYYDIPNPTSGLLSGCSPRRAQEGVWGPLASLGYTFWTGDPCWGQDPVLRVRRSLLPESFLLNQICVLSSSIDYHLSILV